MHICVSIEVMILFQLLKSCSCDCDDVVAGKLGDKKANGVIFVFVYCNYNNFKSAQEKHCCA